MSIQRIHPIHRNRIDWCCAQQAVSVDELAQRVNVKPERLGENLLRSDGLTFSQLKTIAKFFNRGILFFLEDGPVPEGRIHTPQFRTLASQQPEMSAKLKAIIERTEKHRDLFLALQDDLDVRWAMEKAPELSKTNIEASAAMVRAWLGLKEEKCFDEYRASVERKGMLVFRSNGYAGNWQIPSDSAVVGFSLYEKRCHVIFVRKLEPECRQTFTMMHELGHLLLHETSFMDNEEDLFSDRGRESEANRFAGCVLVPEQHLEEIDNERRPRRIEELYQWLKMFRKKWGVSGEVILRRMVDTDRAEMEEYVNYRKYVKNLPISSRGAGGMRFRHREPKHMFGTTYVRTVFDSLRANEITLAKASSYLDNVRIPDLLELEAHLADI